MINLHPRREQMQNLIKCMYNRKIPEDILEPKNNKTNKQTSPDELITQTEGTDKNNHALENAERKARAREDRLQRLR